MAMTESLNLRLKARDMLATPSHEGSAILVDNLFTRQEPKEFKNAYALFAFCITNFPNCFLLMLLKLYRSSSNDLLKDRSISLLSQILNKFRTRYSELSLVALHEFKPLLIECLMQESKESDLQNLVRIVSVIAYKVVICDNNGWFELSNCILSLASTEPLKAFRVFVELPPLYGTFINNFMNIIVEKAEKVLLINPEQSRVEDWSLAVQTIVKMGIQVLGNEMRSDLIMNLVEILGKSVKDLVDKDMEPFAMQGLSHLGNYLSRDKNLYKYNHHQCEFVKSFMYKIKDYGTQIGDITRKIIHLVETPDNPATKLSPSPDQRDNGAEFECRLSDHLKTLSPLEVLKFFATTGREERSREIAIRRLEVLLSDHSSQKKYIDISEIRQLQPLLISCLKEKGISDSMFKVLGRVVNHVAYEIFVYQGDTWYALRDYIISQSETHFERSVYIFQCLTMNLPDEDFVVPMMKHLIPAIKKWLKPPRELLVDNSCWGLAFTGAFCAVLALIYSPSVDVQDLAEGMTDSVRGLVVRKMEVGLVRRAFIDLERIVKQQLEWYEMKEYKFVKGLLWRLYAIEGMTWGSKSVLWRINVIVERDVVKEDKELPINNSFDWLNLDEDDNEDWNVEWVEDEDKDEN